MPETPQPPAKELYRIANPAEEFHRTMDLIIDYAESAKDIQNLKPEEYLKLHEIAMHAVGFMYSIVEATDECLKDEQT